MGDSFHETAWGLASGQADDAIEAHGSGRFVRGRVARFEGEVGILTGAASGIGAATARRLAGEGARLILADINRDAGAALVKDLGGEGDRVGFAPCDVRDPAQVAELVAGAERRFGRLDLPFNNAGAAAFGTTTEIEPSASSSKLSFRLARAWPFRATTPCGVVTSDRESR